MCRPDFPTGSGPQVFHPELLFSLPSPRSLGREVHPHTKKLKPSEPPTEEDSPPVWICRRGGKAPKLPHPKKTFGPKGPSVLLSLVQYPSLQRRRLPNTSRATSEGNSMIEGAEGTAIRDETQVKANTATAPAPHLPVPVAALNPRRFVPPL